jgi:L-threonylcarbamoyladenylate synthase
MKSSVRVWREEAAGALVEEFRSLLLGGGIAALPTDTFYGLAAHPFNAGALTRLFVLKARPPAKPVLVLVGAPEMLPQVAREVPEAGARLLAKFWPGPLTLILPARPGLPDLLTGGTGTVGVRQPRQAVTCRLLVSLGFPVTGTSANRSGRPPLTVAAEVAREFGGGVDLILDTGPCPGGLPSTIVDVTGALPRLVRAGAVPWATLQEAVPELIQG